MPEKTEPGGLVKSPFRTGCRASLHYGFGGPMWECPGKGKSESISKEVATSQVSGPEQAASSEAASEIRKQVSTGEKGYESTKWLNQVVLARSSLPHLLCPETWPQ